MVGCIQKTIFHPPFTTDLLDNIEGLDQESVQLRLTDSSWRYKYKRVMKLHWSMLPEAEFTMQPDSNAFFVVRKHFSARH